VAHRRDDDGARHLSAIVDERSRGSRPQPRTERVEFEPFIFIYPKL
jgi:hypothetical protein